MSNRINSISFSVIFVSLSALVCLLYCLIQVQYISATGMLVLSPLPNEAQRSLISMRPLPLCSSIYLLKLANSSKFMQVKGDRADYSMIVGQAEKAIFP